MARGGPGAAPRIGRRVRAGPDRVAARRRFACLGSARAPAGDDDRDGRGGSAGRSGGASARAAVAGWRPVAAATTRIGSCHGAGASSGWPGRIARSRTRRPSSGASAGRPRPRATGRRHSPRRSRICRTRGSRWTPRRPWPRPGRSRRSASCGGSSCLGCCRWRGTAAGGIRSAPISDAGSGGTSPAPGGGRPEIIHPDAATWERLSLAPRVVAPADPVAGHALIAAAIRDGASVDGRSRGDHRRRARRRRPDRRAVAAANFSPWAWRQPSASRAWRRLSSTPASPPATPASPDTRPTSPSPSAIPSNRSIEPSAPASRDASSSAQNS